MPMSQPAEIDRVARALLAARGGGPLADAQALAGLPATAQDAYAVQAQVLAGLPGATGGAPRHWKSGGPDRSAVLTHAPLPAAGVRNSPADLRELRLEQRLVEAEVALRLAREVSPAQAAALTPE